jgi:hypothetical protein
LYYLLYVDDSEMQRDACVDGVLDEYSRALYEFSSMLDKSSVMKTRCMLLHSWLAIDVHSMRAALLLAAQWQPNCTPNG